MHVWIAQNAMPSCERNSQVQILRHGEAGGGPASVRHAKAHPEQVQETGRGPPEDHQFPDSQVLPRGPLERPQAAGAVGEFGLGLDLVAYALADPPLSFMGSAGRAVGNHSALAHSRRRSGARVGGKERRRARMMNAKIVNINHLAQGFHLNCVTATENHPESFRPLRGGLLGPWQFSYGSQ